MIALGTGCTARLGTKESKTYGTADNYELRLQPSAKQPVSYKHSTYITGFARLVNRRIAFFRFQLRINDFSCPLPELYIVEGGLVSLLVHMGWELPDPA